VLHNRAIVVGSGIVGLATALALAKQKFSVTVIEKDERCYGASVRNFGMVWAIGQPLESYELAIRSREIWKEIGEAAYLWLNESGSLHVARHDDELAVLEQFYERYHNERRYRMLGESEFGSVRTIARSSGAKGALYSAEELVVNPREAIRSIPDYLSERFGVSFLWNRSVVAVESNMVRTADGSKYDADLVVICSGRDTAVLYPGYYEQLPVIKCKLQMMRGTLRRPGETGPAVCGGLSLVHYQSFAEAADLEALRKRYNEQMNDYMKWGIHVMLSQTSHAEVTIGDSHEYENADDPFVREKINELILDYLHTLTAIDGLKISEQWSGVYLKMQDGRRYVFDKQDEGVYVFNGIGGAGMTLSFGLAERLVNSL
jgi:FAD dependent oxidoreductase TIGR03364